MSCSRWSTSTPVLRVCASFVWFSWLAAPLCRVWRATLSSWWQFLEVRIEGVAFLQAFFTEQKLCQTITSLIILLKILPTYETLTVQPLPVLNQIFTTLVIQYQIQVAKPYHVPTKQPLPIPYWILSTSTSKLCLTYYSYQSLMKYLNPVVVNLLCIEFFAHVFSIFLVSPWCVCTGKEVFGSHFFVFSWCVFVDLNHG